MSMKPVNEPPKDEHKPFVCPVCGEYEFEEFDNYHECPVCGWGNDGSQYKWPDTTGAWNHMSLNQAREAYKRGKKVW